MQFEGTNTGLLFVGWVPPATRDNPFMQSIVNAGRSVAPYFDAFTPFGYSGPLRPESVITDMKSARLPAEMVEIFVERVRPVRDASCRIVVAEPHDQGDWIGYWGQSGRPDEGYLIQYGTLTLPMTAEWRVGRTMACPCGSRDRFGRGCCLMRAS